MNSNVDELTHDNRMQRAFRDHTLGALMVMVSLVAMINGIIIGVGIAVMINNGERVDQLQRQFEVNQVWQARLAGEIQAAGIVLPPQPTERN